MARPVAARTSHLAQARGKLEARESDALPVRGLASEPGVVRAALLPLRYPLML